MWHDHPGGNVSHDHGAFSRYGWVLEGFTEAMIAIMKVLGIMVLVVLAYFLLRWAYTEYYITTHCQDVLGTRICQ
jgi:uncharacterized membrane protein